MPIFAISSCLIEPVDDVIYSVQCGTYECYKMNRLCLSLDRGIPLCAYISLSRRACLKRSSGRILCCVSRYVLCFAV
ncbi:uncharacterized protein BDW43DRAFT_282194 [Aspergillus alliaceus]|uniref:uncharacterized protein n=1 Tax=Petromyces alliaceus TaxID=209559 RepID=UPI0012A4289C|nr:uncharacterized protein BDW43DRAFT_282194 [Aspergillus alliaceus]KAB8231424.1 hypothetical protein BDW43DRAFT_282194 [Aspergillus alliaceus]